MYDPVCFNDDLSLWVSHAFVEPLSQFRLLSYRRNFLNGTYVFEFVRETKFPDLRFLGKS